MPGSDTGAAGAPVLRLQGITKRFGALVANDAISLDLGSGEVLALLRQGLQGASKTQYSTEITGEFIAIDHALARLQPGDLCLILVDQVEEALAHIAQRVAEPYQA